MWVCKYRQENSKLQPKYNCIANIETFNQEHFAWYVQIFNATLIICFKTFTFILCFMETNSRMDVSSYSNFNSPHCHYCHFDAAAKRVSIKTHLHCIHWSINKLSFQFKALISFNFIFPLRVQILTKELIGVLDCVLDSCILCWGVIPMPSWLVRYYLVPTYILDAQMFPG